MFLVQFFQQGTHCVLKPFWLLTPTSSSKGLICVLSKISHKLTLEIISLLASSDDVSVLYWLYFSLTWVYLSLRYWSTVHIEMTLVIRTSIIWHLDYPNTKFHKPHPHLQKPCGSWQLRYLAKCCFPIVKVTRSAENVLITEEKLDICKLMTTDRSYTERYGSRWSTTVARILKENVRHGHGKKILEDRTPDIHKIDNT